MIMRDRSTYWLNDIMPLGHVIRVSQDGTIEEHPSRAVPGTPHAPEAVVMTGYDGQVLAGDEAEWTERMRAAGWEPETGWTGQHGYRGPFMHASEFVGGALARHIAETPGLWVAVEVTCLRGDPEPGDVRCANCGVPVEREDTDRWEDPSQEGEDARGFCPDAADSLHVPEDVPPDDEPAGWALLHMDDGPETDSYVVTLNGQGDLTPEAVAGLRKMPLAEAREIAVTIGSPRITRVSDLAVMPAEPEPGE